MKDLSGAEVKKAAENHNILKEENKKDKIEKPKRNTSGQKRKLSDKADPEESSKAPTE